MYILLFLGVGSTGRRRSCHEVDWPDFTQTGHGRGQNQRQQAH